MRISCVTIILSPYPCRVIFIKHLVTTPSPLDSRVSLEDTEVQTRKITFSGDVAQTVSSRKECTFRSSVTSPVQSTWEEGMWLHRQALVGMQGG